MPKKRHFKQISSEMCAKIPTFWKLSSTFFKAMLNNIKQCPRAHEVIAHRAVPLVGKAQRSRSYPLWVKKRSSGTQWMKETKIQKLHIQ